MKKILAGTATSAALFLAAAVPAADAANERACANGHGTENAHATVPHDNHQAHKSIPYHCR